MAEYETLLKTLKRAYLDINYLLINGFDTNVNECEIDGIKDTIQEIKNIICEVKK